MGPLPSEDQLARMKDNITDFERSRPYILTTILEASRRLAPDSDLTGSLVEDLLAARRPYGDVLLWPEKVEPLLISPDPSIAHTARAVRALAQVQVVRRTTQVQEALDQAAAWLVGRDLGNVSEIIERPLEAGIESSTRGTSLRPGWSRRSCLWACPPATRPSARRWPGSGAATATPRRCGAGTTATSPSG